MAAALLVAMAGPVSAEPEVQSPVEALSPTGEAATAPAVRALQAGRQQARSRQRWQGSDPRWQRLVKGLNLDAAQQAKVRRALLGEREALRRLTSAPTDPVVPRVAAIHAITRVTAERIRAVLNDDQKRLFGQPLPPGYAPAEGRPAVEDWMNAMRRKGG